MEALLSTRDLVRDFTQRRLPGNVSSVRALDGVSLNIAPGARISIVGGSGSGKSTLAACLACLDRPTSGKIYFRNLDLTELPARQLRIIRPELQLVFQDSASAFNPDFTVLQVLDEPIRLRYRLNPDDRQNRIQDLLSLVRLQDNLLSRKTAELSGGQRQRLAIARALSLEPSLLILDEALSALDCSIQAQIANLLIELMDSSHFGEKRPALVMITHDLAMAVRITDEILVMEKGRIVESGASAKIVTMPAEKTTQNLIGAVPSMNLFSRPEPGI